MDVAGNQYKTRHKHVAHYKHWLLCKKYGQDCDCKWWKHVPTTVVETNAVKFCGTLTYTVTELAVPENQTSL